MEEYEITYTVTAKIRIDQSVIDQVNAEWRSMFYNLRNKEDIIKHITYNLLQGSSLSQLDGFANLPDENAKLLDVDYEAERVEKV